MIGITKTMFGAAALIAFGLVSIDGMSAGTSPITKLNIPAQDARVMETSTVNYAALQTEAANALRSLNEKREIAPDTIDSTVRPHCRQQTWPYYSDDCLTGGAGTTKRAPARIVGIDRPAATAPVLVAQATASTIR